MSVQNVKESVGNDVINKCDAVHLSLILVMNEKEINKAIFSRFITEMKKTDAAHNGVIEQNIF
jgi:hypothetical protein